MIKFDIENRVAIVTGGAQGFGLAITERFIESGAKVVIWDIDENEAKKALEKVNSKNLSYQIVDVSDFNKINEKLTEIESLHGKIDIFINNAGVAGMNTTVAEYPIEEWNKVINLNLNAVFYCCKAVVPFMEKNNYGRIVNIASVSAPTNPERRSLGRRPIFALTHGRLSTGAATSTTASSDVAGVRQRWYAAVRLDRNTCSDGGTIYRSWISRRRLLPSTVHSPE